MASADDDHGGPSHPRFAAAVLMVGIVVLIVLLSVLAL
jgi:hypothetical protein